MNTTLKTILIILAIPVIGGGPFFTSQFFGRLQSASYYGGGWMPMMGGNRGGWNSYSAYRPIQLSEKLEQVESMRRWLTDDISHELCTPLTAIKGSMEGWMDGVLPANHETYQQIHLEADRLSRLVDDLQELSRVESHAYQLEIHPVDFTKITPTVAGWLLTQFESKRISLDLDLPHDLPPVLADEDRTMQVLTNLVSKVIQHAKENGRVIISASRIGNVLKVSVRDSGAGISAEHLPHIFDHFYRVDKSRSRRAGGGSGIGLTIANHFVEAQGGRIRVENEGEQKAVHLSLHCL